ncbi:prolyl aminopeptidase [Methylicorpusculum sp.]|uniref:prolyl aminopeptidase n=1 Tax=Methylicorpusculum sp. TaxID=2713644 RepID=UPI0027318704|nr:prolyl aminopeptidase [Methylicorpusculum sp.]MDP2180446.1 prolyl aminopeptidase [Methylicorpusculum sp.]MDP3530846.1 prolyl aminopeptidase [Methylicorpusculum sp.]MDZ4149501.1 prolyl aminopeptidase [Methylicorpusculum sp.]
MKTLYPAIEPFHTFFLETQSQHTVYVEQCGNPQGVPVVFLHGGPCSGCKPDHRRFFDPELYHIVLFDQRGCGRSLPFGELEANNTADLINDMESIRRRLGIPQWVLFAGSWGGTLGLLYAQAHPEAVSAMIIRGIFLARQRDLEWFAKDGAGRIYPEQWLRLVSSLPNASGDHLIQQLNEALWGDDELTRLRAAKEWMAWGGQVALGNDFRPSIQQTADTLTLIKQARMEIHYAVNRYFIEENQILDNCAALRDIPIVIIHGRYDLVCPVEAALQLQEALPGAELVILPNGGHIAQGEEMVDALINSTDNIAKRLA